LSDLSANPDNSSFDSFDVSATEGENVTKRDAEINTQASQAKSTIESFKSQLTVPLALTAATFLMTFLFQIYQQRTQAEFTEGTEWRKALEHVASKDPATAAIGAYEMESFLETKHRSHARDIAMTLLPKLDDHLVFDLILFGALPNIDKSSQSQVVEVDRLLVEQLHDLHKEAVKEDDGKKTLPKDISFSHFLEDPEAFFSKETEGESLRLTLEKTWELDSVTHALSKLWHRNGLWPTATPSGLDLSEIVLFNNDFTGVDFKKARITTGAAFYGGCQVSKDRLPSDVEDGCHK
jgi:hypothetical protein